MLRAMHLIKAIPDEKIGTIAVDFDGTLCERERFPAIGPPKTALIEWLKEKRRCGAKLILWTCREGEDLRAAVAWCADHGLLFDAVNENHAACTLKTRKVVADLYIDDRAALPTYEE